MFKGFLTTILFLNLIIGISQKDTSIKSVSVISEYQPRIKDFPKIKFTPNYSISKKPNSPLTYQFPELKQSDFYAPLPTYPILLNLDSLIPAEKKNYLHLSYGSYKRFIGNGLINLQFKKLDLLKIAATNESFTGNLPFQTVQSSQFSVLINKNFRRFQHFLETKYNYQEFKRFGWEINDPLFFDSFYLKNPWQNLELSYQLKTKSNFFKINFSPNFYYTKGNDFTKEKNESYFKIEAPFYWDINSNNRLILNTSGEFQHFSYQNNGSIINPLKSQLPSQINIINQITKVQTSYNYQQKNLTLLLGVVNNVYNTKYLLLPQINFNWKIPKINLKLDFGFNPEFKTNTFNQLYKNNPYLVVANDSLHFTLHSKAFSQIQFQLFKSLLLNFNFSFNQFKNLPIFLNSPYSAYLLYKNEANLLSFKYEINGLWRVQDNLDIIMDFSYESFSGQETYRKPYGIIPVKFSFLGNWKISPKFNIFSNFKYFSGTNYYDYLKQVDQKTKPGLFLDLGGSYYLTKNWEFFTTINNLFNSKYQRWYAYQSIGLGFQTGIRFHFVLQK